MKKSFEFRILFDFKGQTDFAMSVIEKQDKAEIKIIRCLANKYIAGLVGYRVQSWNKQKLDKGSPLEEILVYKFSPYSKFEFPRQITENQVFCKEDNSMSYTPTPPNGCKWELTY